MITFIFLLFPVILPAAISVKANHNSSHSKGNYKNNHMLMKYNNDLSDSLEFLQLAQSLTPVTNKVTDARYYEMYGQFLIPYVRQKLRTNQKILDKIRNFFFKACEKTSRDFQFGPEEFF